MNHGHQLRHLPREHLNTSTKWETLTKDNLAADGSPRFSPDGKKLAWRAQEGGYRADKWDILVAECAGRHAVRQPYRSCRSSTFRRAVCLVRQCGILSP